MINVIKNLIKKNQPIYNALRKMVFFKDSFPKDIFNFEKLILFEKVYPYTMVGYKRLSNVFELAKIIEKEKIKGDFVECGVWKGGCSAVMGSISDKAKSNRKTWLFDSFEGLPEPTKKDGSLAQQYADDRISGNLKTINQCVGPIEDANKILFNILKLDKQNIIIEKGWFQDVLPKAKERIGDISILRLDGDWYESTKVCLDNLYDNVVSGGYIVVDDYGYWEGARIAVDEFFSQRKIKPNFIKIDDAGVYFKKP